MVDLRKAQLHKYLFSSGTLYHSTIHKSKPTRTKGHSGNLNNINNHS